MNVNKPIKNPKLVKAISLMRQDRTKEPHFFDELFKARFLCPSKIDEGESTKTSNDGKIVSGEDLKISLSLLETEVGERYLMAFTDWNELQKWQNIENQETFLFSVEDYKSIILSEQSYAGFVINPFGENIVFNREFLKSMNLNQKTIKKDEAVMIGEPQNYPQDMIDQLKIYFQSTKSVDKAYLLWMARGNETSYLLVLDSTLTPQELFPTVGEICEPYLNGELLDIVSFDSTFGKNAVENQKTFYQV